MKQSHAQRTKVNAGIALLTFAALVTGLFFVSVVRDNLNLEARDVAFGATFSKPYAESLSTDWKASFIASLDDLGLRRYRIPAYWNQIEPRPDAFDFADLDWIVREAGKRDAIVVMAIGRKLPRWPECHIPDWAIDLSETEQRERVLDMLERVVRRYSDNPTVVAWQVENEPFFDFGECPPADREFLKREAELVRSLDSRPIMITESGELSTWIGATGIADVVGISAYRSVWNKYLGYFYWPIGPRYYARRHEAIAPLVDAVIVSELQAEPWVTESIATVDPDTQRTLMNPARLYDNIDFTRRIGFPEVYLWGIEWWYWNREHDRPEMWNTGKEIIRSAADVPGYAW
jgi:hypothetical protein